MSKQTKTTLALIGGALGIALISAFAALSIQSMYNHHDTPPPPPPPVEAPVAPPPALPPVAQVIAVSPHYVSQSYPVRNCQPVQNVVYGDAKKGIPGAGAVIGGVAGGLAGSAIHGNGRNVAIGVGAAVGALSGNAIQQNMNQPQPQVITSTSCTTHTATKKVQKGYDVTYLYDGVQGSVRMSTPPVGGTIPLPITTGQ